MPIENAQLEVERLVAVLERIVNEKTTQWRDERGGEHGENGWMFARRLQSMASEALPTPPREKIVDQVNSVLSDLGLFVDRTKLPPR